MGEKRYYIRKIETMTREELMAYQWQALKKQIEYTYAKSGLCKRKFKEAKITPDDIKNWQDFINKVPFTNKLDLLVDQQQKPPYGTRLAIPERKIFITYLTSGTSGKGQEVHTDSISDWDAFVDTIKLLYHWAGWKAGDKTMLPLPLGITVAAPLHYDALRLLKCDLFNLGTYDTKTKLEYMKRFKMTNVFTVPAYLATMTNDAEEMGLNLAKDLSVKRIMMATQAYPISFIHKMEETWNAKIYDYYGSTQHGMGSTCENGAVTGDQRGFYHMFEHFAVHEVINPETLQPVKSGEVGELVLTPLNKQASPYLRFRSADRVTWFPNTACDCGRPFSLIEAGTIARYDDMMKIKGINIWPETIDEIILTKSEAAEYQGRLFISNEQKETVEVMVEFKPGTASDSRPKVMKQISDEIRDTTGIGFQVKEAKGTLPRFVFKARRWKDERISGLEAKK